MVREARCCNKGLRVRIPGKEWLLKLFVLGLDSGCAIKLVDGKYQFHPRWRLSTLPFAVFRGFLRNLRKYGLGSLRKTPHGEHPTHRPRSPVRQTALHPTTNQPTHQEDGKRNLRIFNFHFTN